jgi:4-alpha-glucanotransferase
MNIPGRADGNWRSRVSDDMLSPQAFQRLDELTKTSNRLAIPRREIPLAMEASL